MRTRNVVALLRVSGGVRSRPWAAPPSLPSPGAGAAAVQRQPMERRLVRWHMGHSHAKPRKPSQKGGGAEGGAANGDSGVGDESFEAPGDPDKEHNQALMVTYLGLGKNLLLTLGKAVVGVTSNSSALIADAAHSASDMVSDVVAVATLKVARLPADKNHPYGHGKFESIGALSVSALLVTAGGGLVWHAAELVQSVGGAPVPGVAALWVSAGCVVVNEALYHVTLRAGKAARSQTVIANAYHHRADAGASAVALLGIGGSIMGFPWMDPVAGGIVGIMIAYTGAEMVWQSVADLTDTVEEDVVAELEGIIRGVAGVEECKDVRIRRMGPYSIVDAQITVGKSLSVSAASHIAERARAAVMREMKEVTEMLVHISPENMGWTDVSPGGGAGRPREVQDLRTHSQIEADVREVVKKVEQVQRVTHVRVDYLGGAVQVRCGIEVDERLRVWHAADVARNAKSAIEREVHDVSHAAVSIDLDDVCWGACGLTFGPACATSYQIREPISAPRSRSVQKEGGAPMTERGPRA